MSSLKLIQNVLEALTKDEFDRITIAYLKNVDGYRNPIITDGAGDSGIDIRILDPENDKIQIQLTVQKRDVKSKIEEDLVKAKKNVEEYGFSNHLKFFYSRSMQNETIFSLRALARKEYGINLELLDSTILSNTIINFEELHHVLFSSIELFSDKIGKVDPKVYAVNDMLTFGKGANLKIELLKSYITNCLFKNKSQSLTQIHEYVKEHFQQDVERNFIKNTLHKLQTDSKVRKKNSKFLLIQKEERRLEISRNLLQHKEKSFKLKIESILKENNIDTDPKIVYDSIFNFLKSTMQIKLMNT